MGFYGNISSSNKTAFSFDKTYSTREEMDKYADSDGIFLGRYVLIEYDAAPITAWFNSEDFWFYTDSHFAPSSKITKPAQGEIYQNLGRVNGAQSANTQNFYTYDGSAFVAIDESSEAVSPYAYRYNKDVKKYGRGYDSTAWMKRYDTVKNEYRYVMIAELNSVIPNFHLVLDAPKDIADAPYFDSDSTNVDYYLHVAAPFGSRLKQVAKAKSDEPIATFSTPVWEYDEKTGAEKVSYKDEKKYTDIFYNKAGFDAATHTESSVENSINFSLASSQRRYGENTPAIGNSGVSADDIKEWYIHLPAIGNAICKIWDLAYGYSTSDNHRYQEYSSEKADAGSNVTYDRETMIGMINSTRDLLGYTFKKRTAQEGATTTAEDNTLYYDVTTVNGIEVPSQYYYYAYSPSFTKSTSGTYYKKDGGEYVPVNKNAITDSSLYYKLNKRWVLTKIDTPEEDSLYGLIVSLHRLIGTGDSDTRDQSTLLGSINTIKDIVDNIDKQLVPNRLLQTNSSTGVIETSATEFPVTNNGDKTKVLQGNGVWASRLSNINVDVASLETAEDLTAATGNIASDTTHSNTIKLGTANKWIKFAADTSSDTIRVAHALSTLVGKTFESTIADALSKDKYKDNKVTIPTFTTDDAGHIIDGGTQNFYIPNSFETITIAAASTAVTDAESGAGDVYADTIVDAVTLGPQNKWLRLKANASKDTITIGHVTSGVAAEHYGFKEDYGDISSATLASETFGSKILATSFSVDEAGHVTTAKTHAVTLPNNFTAINVGAASTSTSKWSSETNSDSIYADTLEDALTINPGNKWIELHGDRQGDVITASHLVQTISTPDATPATDIDGDKVSEFEFPTETVSWDEAGHITKRETTNRKIKFPHNFKTVTVNAQSGAVSAPTSNTEAVKVVANNQIAAVTLGTSNKWVTLNADSSKRTITAGHTTSLNAETTSGDAEDQTPSFGSTFKVPYVKADEAGHIIALTEHTVKIPQGSLSRSGDQGQIITSLSLAKDSGKLTYAQTNVGSLALTGYAIATSGSDVVATDTVNTAFGKLQKSLSEEKSARETAVNNETSAREQAISDEVTARNAAIAVETEARKQAISTEATARDTAIKNAIDGLVNGAPEALNTLKELAEALNNQPDAITTMTQTIGAVQSAAEAAQKTADDHAALVNNPHSVTAEQIGLGEVTNESKATMFASPAFTGTATLEGKTLATTEDIVTDEHIKDLILQMISTNYKISLTEPSISSIENNNNVLTINVITFADESTIQWEKQVESSWNAVTEAAPVADASSYAVTESGIYRAHIVRTFNGSTSEVYSDNTIVTISEPET